MSTKRLHSVLLIVALGALGALSAHSKVAADDAASGSSTATVQGTVSSTPPYAAKSTVVYLEGVPNKTAVNATVVNKQMAFSPYISIVTAGATVTFTNEDPFPHNIFTPDRDKWDLGQIDQHASKTKTFAKVGDYTLLCNLHPNMKAFVLVVPSSYFAKTDKDGKFTIKDVPAGKYKLTAWSPGMKPETQSVTVGSRAPIHFDLHR